MAQSSSSLTLADAESRLKQAEHHAQELEAMALIALKQRDAMLREQAELLRENERLTEQVNSRRAPGSSSGGGSSKSSMTPRKARRPQPASGGASPLRSPARSSFPSSPTAHSVSAAAELEASVYDWVCEISKLSDVGTVGWKGKTFVLNHLTDLDLPSGKKVSTKGLSFKHVDVEGTKFVVLDSEGSYAPVKVENELSVVEKELSERFIQDVIFELSDYFLCVVNDFTSLDQRYLDRLTRSLQNSKKVFQEVIVVHNCKTVMEPSVMKHIFESQIMHIYGRGKLQTTRIAAVSRVTGELEEHDVQWFKTDFSRHVLLANEDCELGDRTNPWAFALLKNWLRSAFVPVNRRFSVLQSVLQSCNARLSSYFKAGPELIVDATDDRRVKLIRARARDDQMRLQQTSVDASGLMLTRPNSFVPAIDVVQDKLYTIVMDVPGMTNEDIRLSRQNVTTIVKGSRRIPYAELQVKVERSERTYGDFTQTFKVPQEYERRWASVTVVDGVLKIVFKPDTDEEGLAIQ